MTYPTRLLLLLFGMLAPALPASAQTTRPAERPDPAITHVVLISIDGCRPDLLLRADTPVIHALLPHASFTFWARTTAESVTLPSHTSMITGVPPVRHGIQWNADLPLIHPVYPAFPTMFQLAKKVGYTTAMACGKSKFINLAVPGSLDWQYIPDDTHSTDDDVLAHAVEMIHDHKPDLLFVHFPSTDNTGHANGWASPQQMAALANADRCVGEIFKALADAGLDKSTCVIITADHGGAGRSHGPDDPRSRHIPWICVGPGIRQNFDLTTDGPLVVDTEDTFSTICYLLAIPVQRPVDGKPLKEIVERKELLGAP
jgi:predicted AlkP superfamily pyrophosphatase or phosphodiesterase